MDSGSLLVLQNIPPTGGAYRRGDRAVAIGRANAVVVEAWPLGAGQADLRTLDSADPDSGFTATLDTSATVTGITATFKRAIGSVLPFVSAEISVVSGIWMVRLTPIESTAAAIAQGAPGATPWPVRVGDGAGNFMPSGDASARPLFYRGASVPMTTANKAKATNAAATVTYAAGGAGVKHVTSGVKWSFSSDPPVNTLLTVSDGATVIHEDTITKGGPGELLWPDEAGTANTALTVTLGAGGAGVVGTVEVLGKRTEV